MQKCRYKHSWTQAAPGMKQCVACGFYAKGYVCGSRKKFEQEELELKRKKELELKAELKRRQEEEKRRIREFDKSEYVPPKKYSKGDDKPTEKERVSRRPSPIKNHTYLLP